MTLRRTGRVPVKEIARAALWIPVVLVALATGSPIVWLAAVGGLALGLLAVWTVVRRGPRWTAVASASEVDLGADDVAVVMPGLARRDEAVLIVAWRRVEGDQVRAGEPLVLVSSDRLDVELPSPATGTLSRIRCAAGMAATVGSVIAVIAAVSPVDPGEAPAGATV